MTVVCMIPSVNPLTHAHMGTLSDPLLDMSDPSYNNGRMISLFVVFLNVAL